MAQLLSGKDVSADIREKIKTEILSIQETNPDFKPSLAIVQVGGREDSNVYIGQKLKNAANIGIYAQHVQLPNTANQQQILSAVERLNGDATVHGIIVQLPLDTTCPVDTHLITNAIKPCKDVDGLHQENAGRLARGDLQDCILPCTPRGCLELIKRTGQAMSPASD